MIYSQAVAAAVALVASSASAHAPLTGTLVMTQLRCQGYLCPQWALDISRYDTIRYPEEQYQYQLQEPLPLAPTVERSFDMHSSYHPATRAYTASAADYPIAGVDSFWVSTINAYANASTPVHTNVIIAHPDASADHPGALSIRRLVGLNDGRTVAVFSDGCVHEVSIDEQKYKKLFSLTSVTNFAAYMTDAHVVVGNVLKSFVKDAQGYSYLINTDLTTNTVSAPLKLTYVKGANNETPIAAYMISPADGIAERLAVLLAGQFDQINYVDEVTGEMIPIESNLMDASGAIFMCSEGIKECDFWRTSAWDPVGHTLYYQAHFMDGEVAENNLYKMGFTQSKVNGEYYPYINPAMSPMAFGYGSFQWVTIQN